MHDAMPAPQMTSSTEVLLPGSDKPVNMKIGHVDEGVPTLSREEYRVAAQIQANKDAENATYDEEMAKCKADPTRVEPVAPTTRVLPKAPVAVPPSGKPSQAPPAVSAQKTILAQPKGPLSMKRLAAEADVISDRIGALEETVTTKIDGIVDMLTGLIQTAQDMKAQEEGTEPRLPTLPAPAIMGEEKKVEPVPTGMVDATTALRLAPPDDQLQVHDKMEEESRLLTDEHLESLEPPVEDIRLAQLQVYLQRHRPLRDFRRFWHGVCPKAGFNEWPKEMQGQFTELFNSIVMHPKLHTQVRKLTDTFENGQIIGEEQMYRMLVLMAGVCSVYTIVTEE